MEKCDFSSALSIIYKNKKDVLFTRTPLITRLNSYLSTNSTPLELVLPNTRMLNLLMAFKKIL